MREYRNILVVRTDRIGDVVLTTPLLEALRRHYPAATIAIMVTPAAREIVNENPYLSEVIIYDRQGRHKGFFGFWNFVVKLRQKKFDVAFVCHTKKRTNLICFLAGIPERIGYHNNKFGFLLSRKVRDTRPQGFKHESEYCLDLLTELGIEGAESGAFLMVPSVSSQVWAKQFLLSRAVTANDHFIAVHAGGSDYTKRWPHYKFAELIGLLAERYPFKIVLIGGSETQNIAENIIADLSAQVKRNVINAVGMTSISQLGALLKEAKLLISNDSGPVHVAVAVGTPVISIFGKRRRGLSVARWRPLGKRDIAVFIPDDGSWPDEKAESDIKALEGIGAKDVFSHAEKLLGS